MRVRVFELRLVAGGLVALWSLAAVYLLLGYRPGGPIDGLVGATAVLPIGIALVAVAWPPVARGDRAFVGFVGLGLGAALLLVPSLGGVLNQLLGRGPQTLLPSPEAGYPWLLALAATSFMAGVGIARRVLGPGSGRRIRLLRGALIGAVLTAGTGSLFATAAIANDLALRDRPAPSSRFGPTGGNALPPLCDEAISVGRTAVLELDLAADVDRRPAGAVSVTGERAGNDVRWAADVATERTLGRYGAARVGTRAWTRLPNAGWVAAAPADVDGTLVDIQALTAALTAGIRATAEDRGVEFVEGARARHCRVAIDGSTFVIAFPQARWLVGDDTLRRWRGELDFWVFTDGELGQASGSLNGPPDPLGLPGLQATIRVTLTATERDRVRSIVPPVG